MPKSKRNKMVTLSRTEKKGSSSKTALVEDIRKCLDEYAYVYVFSVKNMRNSKLKDVRNEWSHSRFFLGKNKVMAIALGKTPEEEYKDNIHQIAERLEGNVGLLFTNKEKDEVVDWFSSYSESDFARAGSKAVQTFVVPEGPL
eukprot:Colp12_sorted_trinity150504_noHs@27922